MPESFVQAAWIERRQTIVAELLSLPAKSKKGKRRKTIVVGGRILTMSLLDDIDKSVRERRESAKRKKDLQTKRARKRTAKKAEANHSAHTETCIDNNEENNQMSPIQNHQLSALSQEMEVFI
ncbi:hypothetical protein AeMF1_016500 [Aphanomyces euteiches]|nr:hypothetical protein AeMF1_016500 [Aphanomyces euteiches]KAH9131364.1 hypothetical protein AeNC1_019686 [Aphanomyces euteiches]